MAILDWKTYFEVKDQISILEKKWLFNNDSLTKKLIELSQNKFSLEILSESKQFLRKDEYVILNISSSQPEWVREVILKGDNVPWVYARSVILSDFLNQNDTTSLKNIGLHPLGSVLFGKHKFDRSPIEVMIYPEEALPTQYASLKLWARRSCFIAYKQNILVQEVFLPDFWRKASIV